MTTRNDLSGLVRLYDSSEQQHHNNASHKQPRIQSDPVVRLELPHPVSVNHQYGTGRNGQRFLTAKAKSFRDEVGKLCLFHKNRRFTGPVSLFVQWFPPDHKRRDIDNILKALCDALEHGQLLKNDSQIAHLEVTRQEVVASGKLPVELRSLEQLETNPEPPGAA